MDFFSYDSSGRNRYGFGSSGSGSNSLLYGDLLGRGPHPLEKMIGDMVISPKTSDLLQTSCDMPARSPFLPPFPLNSGKGFSTFFGSSETGPDFFKVKSPHPALPPDLFAPPKPEPLSSSEWSPKKLDLSQTINLGNKVSMGTSFNTANLPDSFQLGGKVSVSNIMRAENITGDLIYTYHRKSNLLDTNPYTNPFFDLSPRTPAVSLSVDTWRFDFCEGYLTAQAPFPFPGWQQHDADGQINRVGRVNVHAGLKFDFHIPETHNHTDEVPCIRGQCPVAAAFCRIDYLGLEVKTASKSSGTSFSTGYRFSPDPSAPGSVEIRATHGFRHGQLKHEVSAGISRPLSTKPREKSAFEVGIRSFWDFWRF